MTERPPKPDTGSVLWRRWKEVDHLFEAALDLPTHRRESFLHEQCADDLELVRIVAELLEITGTEDTPVDRPGSALLRAALESDGEATASDGRERDGEALTPWRVSGRHDRP
jgi:hypothetical protein